MKPFSILLLFAAVLALLACTPHVTVDNSTVASLDLNRYVGSWYEIARFDHRFERGLSHCTAQYTLQPDGTVRVVNSGMKGGKAKESVGKAKTTDTAGLLRVSFFGPFYGDYRVLLIAPDYSYALVGSGTDDYLWLLSRTPTISVETKHLLLSEAARRGYDTSRLIWVKQTKP